MKNFLRRILDFVFVRRCVVCGALVKVSDKINICNRCEKKLERLGQTRIVSGNIIVSPLPYVKHVRKAMIKFKFRNKKYYGYTFANLIHRRLMEFEWYPDIQCIVCVPMKNRKRAYNQSAVIAENLSDFMKVPFDEGALYKVKDNPPFYKLKRAERLKLIRGAFEAGNTEHFNGKTVLLIDDIYTTGVTADEAMRILLLNGASKVYCATACHGINLQLKL